MQPTDADLDWGLQHRFERLLSMTVLLTIPNPPVLPVSYGGGYNSLRRGGVPL